MKQQLEIYLNDHLAGATLGTELARRAAKENRGTTFGAPLDRLAAEIASDRRSLMDIMATLGVPRSTAMQALGRIAERVGRLKPNGQLRGYTALARVLELEGLQAGVGGKLDLWRTLLVSSDDLRVDRGWLEGLIERAERQRQELEDLHDRAAALVVNPNAPTASYRTKPRRSETHTQPLETPMTPRAREDDDRVEDDPDPVMTAQGAVEPPVGIPDAEMTADGAIEPPVEVPDSVMTAQGAVAPTEDTPEPVMTAQGAVLPHDKHDRKRKKRKASS